MVLYKLFIIIYYYVGLYLRIIVSKSHGYTSMFVDTVTIFQKL